MDEIELAKSVFDEIIEETESENWNKPISKTAQKGGQIRAKKLSDERKTEIAKKAAQTRWQKSSK